MSICAQTISHGCERIGYCIVDDNTEIKTPYAPENDVLFYTGIEGSSATVKPGEMTVLFPGDAHRSCIRPGENAGRVRKAVVKVML